MSMIQTSHADALAMRLFGLSHVAKPAADVHATTSAFPSGMRGSGAFEMPGAIGPDGFPSAPVADAAAAATPPDTTKRTWVKLMNDAITRGHLPPSIYHG